MKILIFLLISVLLTFNAFARPIFGTFTLSQIKAPDKTFAVDLEKSFLNSLKRAEFENAISAQDREILNRVKSRGTKKDYEIELKNVLGSKSPNLNFNIAVRDEKDGLKKLVFNIVNKDSQNIFYRESTFDYETLDEFQNRLTFWVEEFKNILPPVGEVVRSENGYLTIKIVHGSSTDQYVGRPFHVGYFKYESDFSYDSYEKMGAVTTQTGALFQGQVYSKYKALNVSKGDHILFLKSEDFSLKNRERVTKSETYFNYLNSPQYSLLDCSLLPIIGNMKSNEQFYKRLSKVVVSNKLCKYRDDKNVEKILKKYKGQLEEYLNNEVVLSNLANILRVGALFRMGIHKVINGVSVQFDVISENGKNIYYSKYKILEEYDEDFIAQLLLGWIIDYKKTLPLTGRIIQIRGENLLIDIPAGLVEGTKQEFKIIRPLSLVYEELKNNRQVTWKTKTIAYGTIDAIRKNHSIGTVFKFENKRSKIREGDWVFIEDLSFQVKKDTYLIKKHNVKSDRNIGNIKVSTEFTRIETENNEETIAGLAAALDLYLPFGLVLAGEVVRNFSGGDQSISNNNINIALGYSFTPRIYDYFAVIDTFIGNRIVNYNLARLDETGIGDLKYSGIFFGVRSEIPIYKKFSLEGQLNFNPADTLENTNDNFGEFQKSNGLDIMLAGKYRLNKTNKIYLEFHTKNYNTTYDDGNSEINLRIRSNLIKIGYGISF